jgi:hypothetical protein
MLHESLGESKAVEAGQPLDPSWLRSGNLIGIAGKPSIPFLIREVQPLDGGGLRVSGSNLAVNKKRVFTLAELEAIRPLYFVLLPAGVFPTLRNFVEGGIYQAWPTGEIVEVQRRLLVNPLTGQRVTSLSAFPVLIPRWIPPTAADITEGEG